MRGLLPQNEPYWLLAESFSGPIGISIAACAPTNLRGLILCCSFARNPLLWLAFARHLIGLAPVKLLPTVLLSRLILGRFTTTRRRAALAMALRSVSQAALQARARAVLAVNVSKELARIDLPVIYLRATEDRIVPAACGDHAAVVLPRLRIETFVGPHFLLQVSPVEVAARLLELTRLDPSRFG